MKKHFLTTFLFFITIYIAKSQGGGGVTSIIVALSQRSTVLYSDTVFEQDQLKFKVTETYAFRDKIKTTIILTNLSDNFKTIYSEDFTITDAENNPIVINSKKPMVIAPKSSKKFGLMAESKASFKLYDIKIGLKQIYSTGNAINTLKPNQFNLHLEGIEGCKVGPLEITSIKCNGEPNGSTKAYFKLNYTGTNFLGIYGSKAMLVKENNAAYLSFAPKSKTTYYPANKPAFSMMLEFENPNPNFDGQSCDKVKFENVFVEYESKSDNKSLEFHVYKNGLSKGDSPKEKKEADKENTED